VSTWTRVLALATRPLLRGIRAPDANELSAAFRPTLIVVIVRTACVKMSTIEPLPATQQLGVVLGFAMVIGATFAFSATPASVAGSTPLARSPVAVEKSGLVA